MHDASEVDGIDFDLHERLMRAGVLLNLGMPKRVTEVFIFLLVEAMGTGKLSVSASLRQIGEVVPGGISVVQASLIWLENKGFITRVPGYRANRTGYQTLQLEAMEAEALRVRARYPDYAAMLEHAGLIAPLEGRKRKRIPE